MHDDPPEQRTIGHMLADKAERTVRRASSVQTEINRGSIENYWKSKFS